MTEAAKKELIAKMQENLQILRLKLKLTQAQLAATIGVSRYTIMSIENKSRQMLWNTFLSLILIFSKNKDTADMLALFGIYNDELNDMLELKLNCRLVAGNRCFGGTEIMEIWDVLDENRQPLGRVHNREMK